MIDYIIPRKNMNSILIISAFILGIFSDAFRQFATFVFNRKNVELSNIDDAYELSYTMVDYFSRKSREINMAFFFLKNKVHLPLEKNTTENPLPKLLKILDLHLNLNNEENEIISRIKKLEDEYTLPMMTVLLAAQEFDGERDKYISQGIEASNSLIEKSKFLREDILNILKKKSQKIKNKNVLSKFQSYFSDLINSYSDYKISPLQDYKDSDQQ